MVEKLVANNIIVALRPAGIRVAPHLFNTAADVERLLRCVAGIDEVIVGESHAWVAAFTGTVWPLDPTSLNPVEERHIRVAAGRDYHDVAPFRGIYAGRADQELEVTVELVRKA